MRRPKTPGIQRRIPSTATGLCSPVFLCQRESLPYCFGSRLYRDGHLIDVRLSDTRDLTAAETFCRFAWTVIGVTPEHITIDRDDAYPRAIRSVFGDQVIHRTNRYLNDHLEQDHRGIKQRYRSMGGFKADTTAVHFCGPFDEVRSLLRPQSCRNQPLSLAQRRDIHQVRFIQLMELMAAA